jgi:hypothetical protein
LAELAQSFGADGATVETERDFSNALSAAVKTKRITFIRMRIDATGCVAQFNKGALARTPLEGMKCGKANKLKSTTSSTTRAHWVPANYIESNIDS